MLQERQQKETAKVRRKGVWVKRLECKTFMLEKEDRCSRNCGRGRGNEGEMLKLSMSVKF